MTGGSNDNLCNAYKKFIIFLTLLKIIFLKCDYLSYVK